MTELFPLANRSRYPLYYSFHLVLLTSRWMRFFVSAQIIHHISWHVLFLPVMPFATTLDSSCLPTLPAPIALLVPIARLARPPRLILPISPNLSHFTSPSRSLRSLVGFVELLDLGNTNLSRSQNPTSNHPTLFSNLNNFPRSPLPTTLFRSRNTRRDLERSFV